MVVLKNQPRAYDRPGLILYVFGIKRLELSAVLIYRFVYRNIPEISVEVS